MTTEEQLELLKHKLRMRELLLEKLGFAAVLVVLAFVGNCTLQRAEARLQAELKRQERESNEKFAELRSSAEIRRAVAQGEVTAHEEVWKAIADFRRKVHAYLGKTADETSVGAVQAALIELGHAVDRAGLYLSDETSRKVEDLITKRLPEFTERWEQDGAAGMSETTATFLAEATDVVREQIQADIRIRQQASTPP